MARSPQGNDRAQILGVVTKEERLQFIIHIIISLMMSGKKGTE